MAEASQPKGEVTLPGLHPLPNRVGPTQRTDSENKIPKLGHLNGFDLPPVFKGNIAALRNEQCPAPIAISCLVSSSTNDRGLESRRSTSSTEIKKGSRTEPFDLTGRGERI